jgi:hypothetical protein
MRRRRITNHENRPLSQKRRNEHKELVPISRAGSQARHHESQHAKAMGERFFLLSVVYIPVPVTVSVYRPTWTFGQLNKFGESVHYS